VYWRTLWASARPGATATRVAPFRFDRFPASTTTLTDDNRPYDRTMITGDLKSRVDRIWDTMWSGGIANPLTVIAQLTYLLFIKRLDELHTLAEQKANRTGKPVEDAVFSKNEQHLPSARVLQNVVDQLDDIPMEDADTKDSTWRHES